MMRPYILTRLRNEEGAWEYTRYLAEANAILRLNEPEWLKILPLPQKAEYQAEDVPSVPLNPTAVQVTPPDVPPLSTREEAIQALREKNYEPAIDFFKREVQPRPNYHSGWSRLGYAQREYAAHLIDSDNIDEAKAQLGGSLASYGKAVQHADERYSAEAHYNRSKAHWRLWKLTHAPDDLKAAIEDADSAVKKYYEGRFLSWSEYLEQDRF